MINNDDKKLLLEKIKELCKKDIREAKKLLAFEVTKLVHGEENALAAKKAAEELFSGSISATNVPTINVISKNLNKNIIDFLVDIKFLTSKSFVVT